MKPAKMVAILLAALLVFYPLSLGPFIRITHYGIWSPLPPATETFYAPVFWLSRYPPISNAYKWYIGLWMPKIERG